METEVLNGSMAIARGILEAGISVIAGYPGTPGTYALDRLLEMPEAKDVDIQWSANEKAALEVAYGASLGGVRSVAGMKGLGLNVALDSLMVMNLAGSLGGLVIVVGDDPGAPGSSNEQDTRLLGAFAEIPTLEPAEVTQATELVKYAFEISERLKTPVLFRGVRELARTEAEVTLGRISPPRKAEFIRRKDLWKSLPQYAVSAHRKVHKKLARAAKIFSNCQFNSIEGSGDLGVVACGFTYTRLKQVLEILPETKLRILKLCTVFPLPQGLTEDFLARVKRILVLEETEPLVERELNILAKKEGTRKPIFGKLTGHLPGEDETSMEVIFKALRELLGEKARTPSALRKEFRPKVSEAGFCEDCPFVPAFEGLLEVVKELKIPRPIVAGDPGCLIRLDRPPFDFLDVKMSLGSSIGIAEGLKRAGLSQPTIAITGDSAFMHTGLSAFASAAANGANLLLIILDNRAVVLTGLQPRIGTGKRARGKGKKVSLLRILRALGADFAARINPEDKSSVKAAFTKALKMTGLRAIVLEAPCPRFSMASFPVDINKALAGKRFHLICGAIWFAAEPFWIFLFFCIIGYYLGAKLGVPFNWRLFLLICPFLYVPASVVLIPHFLVYRNATKGSSALVDMQCPECKKAPSVQNGRELFKRVVEETPCPLCGEPYKFKYTRKFKLLQGVCGGFAGVLIGSFLIAYWEYLLPLYG